ncbi:MAG: NUDIX hydrolase, partial [Cyclobacteriaceae bacterium]
MTIEATLSRLLDKYQTTYAEEKEYKNRFYSLLEEPDCFERKNLERHFTGSCWVTDQERENVLLLHHAKLQRWLQPGGHADGDANLIAVARKELIEETGMQTIFSLPEKIFDIDIHVIPERKNVPRHEHFDARFHFIATTDQQLQINNESTALKWVPIDKVYELT